MRGDLVETLSRELLGPFDGPGEVLRQRPTGRYLLGRLAPAGTAVSPEEDEGAADSGTGDDASDTGYASPESLAPPPAPTLSHSHNPYEERIKHFARGLHWARAIILVALGPVIGWSLLGITFVISSRTLLDISEIWLLSSIFVLYLYALFLISYSATARRWRRKEGQIQRAWKAGTLNSFALRALLKTPPPPSSTAPTRCRRGIALGGARRWRSRR